MYYIAWSVAFMVVRLMGFYYTRSAWTISGTFKFYYPTDIVTFDPEGVTLPAGANNFIAPTRQALRQLGFEPAGYFALPSALSNVKTINLLAINRRTVESALVNCIYAEEDGGYALQNEHVEFLTRFRDGACLQTNNSWQLSSFATEPNDHVVQFWDVQDVSELHSRHQRIGEQLSRLTKRLRLVEDFRSNVETYVDRAVLQESLEYQVKVGRLRRVKNGYVATPKGACLIAWQLQFPWQNIRRWWTRRTAERWLAAIGG